VYTIKPSDGRVPWTGHIPPEPGTPWDLRHLAAIGPIARSVEDLALALRLIGGPDGADWTVAPVPFEDAEDVAVRTLRLAWVEDFGVPVTAETKVALRRLAGAVQQLGGRVEQRWPDGFDLPRAWDLWGELRQMEVGSAMSAEAEAADLAARGAAEDSDTPWLRARARVVNATARQHAVSLRARDALITALERFFESWDALLCPVASGPAFPHCPTGTPIAVDGQMVPYWVAAGAYCMPFNATGHPAVVLPLARSAAGLPIGLQVVGPRWSDARLLGLAARLAMVIGPFTRPPGY
jgi:amidase